MKNFAKSFFCLLSLSSLLIFTTCEDNVGLGSSVDTDRPSVTITYPPAASDGARIKGVFELGGRWSDDKSLSSIKVTLTYKTTEKTVNAEGKEVSTTREDIAWTGNADINPDGTWKCRLNEKNDEEYKSTNGWKFCDGSYSVKAVAVDGAGRSSDPAARELTIDNTAPVIVLTEPSSVGASNNVTSYGRTVQFVGNFAEDDPLGISKLTVSLYDAGGSKLADADFTNIQNMDNSNPLIIAEYYDSDIDNRADANWAKWHWYETHYTASKIADYRNTTTATDEKFYFSLTAYDSAAEYNDFTGGSENKCGNETTVYYRGTTDMKTLISNKNSEFQDFTVFRLKQYLNGTNGVYEAYKDSADLESILDEAKCLSVKDDDISADISNTSTSQGNVYPVFTMNPANNPTYTIDGLAVNTSTTDTTHFTDGYPSYYSDSSISANIKVGLDKNNTIITNTVSIYYTKEGETEKNLFWTWNKTVAREYAQKKGLDMDILSDSALESSSLVPDEYRFTPTADSENSSEVKVSASLSVVKKDIIAGKKYTFTVEGHDITGQNILASSDEGYGFFAKSNSEAPTINIGDENGNINIPSAGVIKASVLSDGSFGFMGTVFSPAEEISSSAITYDVTVADTTDSINKNAKVEKHAMAAFAEDEEEQNKYTYNWSFNFTQTPAIASLIADGQGLYTVDVTINATNGGGTMKLPRSYFLDTVNPAVSNVAVSGSYRPSDDKFFINSTKTFTLSGNTTDNYIVGSTKYEFIGKDSSGNAKTVSDSSTAISWSFTNINLSSFKAQENTDDVLLRITATDKAGNKSVKEFSIEFDDTEPAGKHIYDKNSKDVIFRVGEGDNDLAELKAWNSGITALADKDKDVGGKYQAGTWGSAQTITIRGDWIEEGSGVKMIYYKIFDAEPDAAAIAAFKADPATQKTGSIAPLSAPVTKRISYTDSTGSRSFTDTQYSFKQAISGFNAEKNYLLLAAEDNVGNIGIDTLKASDINDGYVSANTVWNRNLDSFSLNVDTEPPLLSSSTSGSQYTNKVAAIALSGTATDNASGVSSVTIKIGDTVIAGTSEVPVTIADTGTTENKSVTWTTSVPAAKLSSLEQG
ncbi:MAG: hypothetical protein J6Y93_01025, partial [Treponema sp.]|nr:hypothetical protein [Treponema sp.]